MRIALDAMGGDYARRCTIAGAVMAVKEYPKIRRLFLTGDEARGEEGSFRSTGCGDRASKSSIRPGRRDERTLRRRCDPPKRILRR